MLTIWEQTIDVMYKKSHGCISVNHFVVDVLNYMAVKETSLQTDIKCIWCSQVIVCK